MGANRDTSANISLRDVGVLWRELGAQYGGDLTSELVLPVRADSAVHMFVRVWYRPRNLGVRRTRAACCVGAAWPNGQSRTLAGLLFRLTYELGQNLEAQPPVDPTLPAEQTRFA
jgi:hypothetical protein